MCNPGESETSRTGKLMASITICHSTSSGTSGVANGFTTRKHTSVNGSFRNSSSSSGECLAISAGIYRPPSGANPRSTAPRNEVSGALRDVLRYLILRNWKAAIRDRKHTSELQSRGHLVCRLLLEKKKHDSVRY